MSKSNKKNKNYLITLSVLMVIAIIIALCINIISIIIDKNKRNDLQQNELGVSNTEEEDNLNELRDEKLMSSTETTRIKYYVGRFFATIESEEYQEAYDMLFEDFKGNYFKTVEDFEKYVTDKYPRNVVLEYENIGREGEIYVITLKIINGLDTSNVIEQKVVIKELSLNKFNISFQVN